MGETVDLSIIRILSYFRFVRFISKSGGSFEITRHAVNERKIASMARGCRGVFEYLLEFPHGVGMISGERERQGKIVTQRQVIGMQSEAGTVIGLGGPRRTRHFMGNRQLIEKAGFLARRQSHLEM